MTTEKSKIEKEKERVLLGLDTVFGIAHITAHLNDTFVHVTDLSGRETIARIIGNMDDKSKRVANCPHASNLAAKAVAEKCRVLGITALHIRLHANTSNRSKFPGRGTHSALRALVRSSLKMGRVEYVTPIPVDTTCRRNTDRRRKRRL